MDGPERIGKVISSIPMKARVKRKYQLEILRMRWGEVVGEELSRNSRPMRIRAGTLHVAANGSSWAAELQMASENIRNCAEAILGSKKVKAVKIESKPTLFVSEVKRKEEHLNCEDDDSPVVMHGLSDIKDKDLRIALERMVRARAKPKGEKQ
ncbi:MAG: DUF721 domain-containing protein [Actinomycetota bacterium]|nr:DUF721 domain-containing protein [Actinomycetota bacterium]